MAFGGGVYSFRNLVQEELWGPEWVCASSEHMAPLELFPERYFSALTFSSLGYLKHAGVYLNVWCWPTSVIHIAKFTAR